MNDAKLEILRMKELMAGYISEALFESGQWDACSFDGDDEKGQNDLFTAETAGKVLAERMIYVGQRKDFPGIPDEIGYWGSPILVFIPSTYVGPTPNA